jgi:hypothetical protein
MGGRLWSPKFMEHRSTTIILYIGNSVHIFIFTCCIITGAQHISQRVVMCTHIVSYNKIMTLSNVGFLQKYIVTHLWKTLHDQARWLQHLTTRSLSQKQTDSECMTCSVFENSASHDFECSRVRPMGRATNKHLARLDLRKTRMS